MTSLSNTNPISFSSDASILRARPGADANSAATFATMLGQASRPAEGTSHDEQARESAEMLVALTFIKPILSQMRESNGAAPPFAPTSGEKQFGSLLDTRLAQQIVKAAGLPIVDRILEGRVGTPPATNAPPTPGHHAEEQA